MFPTRKRKADYMHDQSVWQELLNALKEYDDKVCSGSISLIESHDAASSAQRPHLQLCILEGVWLVISLSDCGFTIISAHLATEAIETARTTLSKVLEFANAWFESMDALLSTVSPLYRGRFHQSLFDRLTALQTEDGESQN
ncbi:hypothetical protein SpCBS45565_g02965 [Spizellomyces sp. 'palustris']|nr:hypothetical protein SpCBS45565_g02965 [Spizellomyces sp. 'palustris']